MVAAHRYGLARVRLAGRDRRRRAGRRGAPDVRRVRASCRAPTRCRGRSCSWRRGGCSGHGCKKLGRSSGRRFSWAWRSGPASSRSSSCPSYGGSCGTGRDVGSLVKVAARLTAASAVVALVVQPVDIHEPARDPSGDSDHRGRHQPRHHHDRRHRPRDRPSGPYAAHSRAGRRGRGAGGEPQVAAVPAADLGLPRMPVSLDVQVDRVRAAPQGAAGRRPGRRRHGVFLQLESAALRRAGGPAAALAHSSLGPSPRSAKDVVRLFAVNLTSHGDAARSAGSRPTSRPGTRVYVPELIRTLLPTSESSAALWNELIAPRCLQAASWRPECAGSASGPTGGGRLRGPPGPVRGKPHTGPRLPAPVVHARGAALAGPALRRRRQDVHGLRRDRLLPAAFLRTGGVLVYRPLVDGDLPPELGAPAMAFPGPGGNDTLIFVSPELRAKIPQGALP